MIIINCSLAELTGFFFRVSIFRDIKLQILLHIKRGLIDLFFLRHSREGLCIKKKRIYLNFLKVNCFGLLAQKALYFINIDNQILRISGKEKNSRRES